MPVDYPNIAEGQRLASDRLGFEATIEYIVDEQAVGATQICDAIGRGFQLNDPHPCGLGITCVDQVVRPIPGDHSKFSVIYTFRAPELEATIAGEFSMTGSLTEQVTTRDRNDAQAKLQYTYPLTYKDPALAGQTREQVAELNYAAPTLLLRWSRLQSLFATAWTNRAVLGHVNEFPIWGFPAGRLFCTRMEIERANSVYREMFEFQEGDWGINAIFRQEDDNRPVPDPDALAEKTVDVYPVFDFGSLGLALPT